MVKTDSLPTSPSLELVSAGVTNDRPELAVIPELQVHPDGFFLPRQFYGPPESADFSAGDACIEWCNERFPGSPMDPWQRWLTRLLWARVNGEFWTRVAVIRLSRQWGKTWWVRRMLGWRLMGGSEFFQGPQRILTVAPAGAQSAAMVADTARQFGYGGKHGTRGLFNTTSAAHWCPHGEINDYEPAWKSAAMTVASITGVAGINCAHVDEVQNAKRAVVQDALAGTLSGKRVHAPLMLYTGTGCKEHSDHLRALREQAGQEGMLWAAWSIHPGMPRADPMTWRWGGPEWDPGRERLLAGLQKTMEPELFDQNFLLADEDEAGHSNGFVDADVWEALHCSLDDVPDGFRWTHAAVESWFGSPPVLALVGAVSEGKHLVKVSVVADRAAAAEQLALWQIQNPVVGASLLQDGVFSRSNATAKVGTPTAALSEFRRMCLEGRIVVHPDNDLLDRQVTKVRFHGETDALVSKGACESIKAVAWAMGSVQNETWFAF